MTCIKGAIPQTKQEYTEMCTDVNVTPLKVKRHGDIIYGIFRLNDVQILLDRWERHEYVPAILGMTIGPMPIKTYKKTYWTACYTVFENETGDFYMEDCVQRNTALRWLTGEADTQDVYDANKRIIHHLEANPHHIKPWTEEQRC